MGLQTDQHQEGQTVDMLIFCLYLLIYVRCWTRLLPLVLGAALRPPLSSTALKSSLFQPTGSSGDYEWLLFSQQMRSHQHLAGG